MSRVLCRRGVARGALSAAFSADDLLRALHGDDAVYAYVEPDEAGHMAGGGARAARLCVLARLAPSAPARRAELALAPRGPGPAPAGLVLRAAVALAPHQELLLWFAEDTLAALDMPFLTPRNIRGRRNYACHDCGAGFDEPNPLKLHLFLRCEPFDAARFWREAAARLRPAAVPAPGPPATALGLPPAGPGLPPAGPGLPPAELEALATEWGRSRAGHVCLYCGKLYSRRYGLKIHLRTHTGYRPLRCRYCLRAFGDPSNLNKHVRLHAARAAGGAAPPGGGAAPPGGGAAPPGGGAAPPGGGAAPWGCAVCGRVLARRRDLERHRRVHAPPLPADPGSPPGDQ